MHMKYDNLAHKNQNTKILTFYESLFQINISKHDITYWNYCHWKCVFLMEFYSRWLTQNSQPSLLTQTASLLSHHNTYTAWKHSGFMLVGAGSHFTACLPGQPCVARSALQMRQTQYCKHTHQSHFISIHSRRVKILA